MRTRKKTEFGQVASPSRRRLLALGAGGVMASGLLRPARAHAADIEEALVFACDGGNTQNAFEKDIFPDFAKQYGGNVRLIYVPGQPADNLAKLRVQKNSPTIDVMWLAGGVTYQAIDAGLVETIDTSRLANLKYVPESIGIEKAAVPIGLAVVQMTYNVKVFAANKWTPPTSWLDYWDPKYKGHVGLPSINLSSAVSFLVNLARILTGDYKKVDAAFDKLEQLRPSMLNFFSSIGATETALQQDEMWIGLLTAQRAWQLKNQGTKIGYAQPKDGVPGYQTWAGVVKGAPHPKAAYAWVDYLLSIEGQTKVKNVLGYTPVNSALQVSAEDRLYFPDVKNVFIPDWRYIATQLPSYVDKWNRKVER